MSEIIDLHLLENEEEKKPIVYQDEEKQAIFELLQESLAGITSNNLEDIKPESLIYNELNLTEFDLQRLVKELGNKVEINVEEMIETVTGEQITSVADLLDLLIDEKDLG